MKILSKITATELVTTKKLGTNAIEINGNIMENKFSILFDEAKDGEVGVQMHKEIMENNKITTCLGSKDMSILMKEKRDSLNVSVKNK